ncbi:MAG: CDP-glycerol glycerophosphotransferase family protein [Lactobacillaceae bacterium]|jgi:CDP-glycerol glycerophosphotransferase (TagB/SpsB family)|nr:CDP-glycerol glycerophosphotransferase family protein [Lactobacillaceae bacterium]
MIMNQWLYQLLIKLNTPVRNLVNATGNFRSLSRFYASNYDKIKVDANIYLYETRDGQNLSDSPLAFLKVLVKRDGLQHYVVFDEAYLEDVELSLELQGIEFGDDSNVHLVERNSFEYIKLMLSAKVLLNNSTFQSFFLKKPEQIYMNTWHGTPLKTMGYAMPEGDFNSWNVMRNFLMTDYLISPNEHTTKIFTDDYKLCDAYTGEILQFGYPRNDVFFEAPDAKLLDFLTQQYNLDSHKQNLLYAPTWTDNLLNMAAYEIDAMYMKDYELLESKLGKQYNILFKVHPFVYAKLKEADSLETFVVRDGIDPSSILALTDLLITDFSSIFFDFLNTDKPVVFFNEDPSEYEDNRGAYIDINNIPGPFYSDMHDVIDYISAGDFSVYADVYQSFKNKFVTFDGPKRAEQILDYVAKKTEAQANQVVKVKSDKPSVLIYTGGLQKNGISEALINLVNNIDQTKYDLSLLVADQRYNAAFYQNYKRLKAGYRLFVVFGESSYGWRSLLTKEISEKHGYIGILRRLYPKHSAQINAQRLTADVHFDIAIDFDSYVMDNGQWISAVNADKTYNVLHNDMWLEANKLVNGKLKNPKTKQYVPFWNLFDTSLSVSEATMEINKRKLKKYINGSGVLTNFIDYQTILNKVQEDVSYSQYDVTTRLDEVDMTNSAQLTSATFGVVDEAKRSASIVSADATRAAKVFITNSRLSPEKNIDNLILAFVKLHAKYPDVKLQIFGSDVGNYAPVLYQLVVENAATDYITFHGYANNSFPAIKQADVFLLPSHTEGQSIALMEAMVLGKDIMASNILANIELLDGGDYGLLTEGNDVDALLASLEIMAAGRYQRLKTFDPIEHNKIAFQQFEDLFN